MNEVARLHPDKRIELWFQDEARFGQQGTVSRVWAQTGSRPDGFKQTDYRWLYLFGAVCPATGAAHGCLLPWANTDVMNQYLLNFSKSLARDIHVLLVMDGAGWHRTGGLTIPENLSLLLLPAYSPRLNPSELCWREMRQKQLSNRVFPEEDDLWKAVEAAWLWLIADRQSLQSLCAFPWILSAINKLN